MISTEEVKDLQDRFDQRYKLKSECEDDMKAVTDTQHTQEIDIRLVMQQLQIIKWVAVTTLGAVIVGIVGLIVARIAGG